MNISFSTHNSAFKKCFTEEITRILQTIIKEVKHSQHCGEIYDIDGNKIGQWID